MFYICICVIIKFILKIKQMEILLQGRKDTRQKTQKSIKKMYQPQTGY